MYLEIDEHFATHRKSLAMNARLQHPVAWAYIQKLWMWACGNAQDGELLDCDGPTIEEIVGWTLADGKFYAAAVAVRLIDEERDTEGTVVRRSIHNWMKPGRTGFSIAKMKASSEAGKERKRLWKERDERRLAEEKERQSLAQNTDGTNTDAAGTRTERGGNAPGTPLDKTSLGKSSDPDLPLPHLGSQSDADLRAGSNPHANPQVPSPLPPVAYRPVPRVYLAAATPAFIAVYDAYTNKTGKQEAAQAFAELAESYPGGEAALSAAILRAFTGGMLKRHPYNSPDPAFRTSLEKFLAGRRWEDAAPPAVETAKSIEEQQKSRARMESRRVLAEIEAADRAAAAGGGR